MSIYFFKLHFFHILLFSLSFSNAFILNLKFATLLNYPFYLNNNVKADN